jgi:transmembrane sensor
VRLDAFVAELGRYRHGLLRCDPAVAGLRLTGAFQLADTEAVLHNLAQLLPVQLLYRTRYWVTLVPAA